MQHASERAMPVRATVTLPGQPQYVRWARELVTIALGRGHPGYEPLALIVSELFTNSIVHSRSRLDGGTVTVTLLRSPGGTLSNRDSIRVEVTDDGAASLRPCGRWTPGRRAAGGCIWFDALAACWNCARDPAGTTTTWADVIV